MTEGGILVTGGSRGIGRAIVEMLVGDGWPVAFTWRSAEKEAGAVEAATGGRARPFPLDVRDRERPSALVEEVEHAIGPLRGLVNNAGIRKDGLLAFTRDDDWNDVLDTDLGGVHRMCRAVVPGMVHRRGGSIVNIASLSAFHGVSGQTAYGAAKAGVVGLTRCLAREIGRRGIRVNAVVPGYVETDFTAGIPEKAVEALKRSQCLPQDTTPAAVAGAVAFLLSDRSEAITGQALFVDAGSSA